MAEFLRSPDALGGTPDCQVVAGHVPVVRTEVGAALDRQDPALVDLKDLFPDEYSSGRSFEIPDYAFAPDAWTRAIIRGLSNPQLALEGRCVAEIGVGTGAGSAYVLSERNPKILFGSDLDERLPLLAERNIRRNVNGRAGNFRPIKGSQNLTRWLVQEDGVEVAFGCLPQVVIPSDMQLLEGDHRAHYYDPREYPSELHHLGLGLNDCMLRETHPKLANGGSVVLNLSGRPGREQVLDEMLFRENGYEPHLLYEQLIQQHVGTSLETLAQVESQNGTRFEFFRDEDGRSQIDAAAAEELRITGQPIYHKIYVIEGRKITS